MRRRRDPFARCTYVPVMRAAYTGATCSWCGTAPIPRHQLYDVVVMPDSGRDHTLTGHFESWACAEAYHDGRIGR